jgi:hypothetical protein
MPAEVQPDNYIQECLAEAERTYQAWSTPPAPASTPATSGVPPAHATGPTNRRGRGYLLTQWTSPVSENSLSENNARPDTEELPATSSRIVPTRPTVRAQPYP